MGEMSENLARGIRVLRYWCEQCGATPTVCAHGTLDNEPRDAEIARLTAELTAVRDALGVDGTGTVTNKPLPACIAQIRADNGRLRDDLSASQERERVLRNLLARTRETLFGGALRDEVDEVLRTGGSDGNEI